MKVRSLLILIPVFDEWDLLRTLLSRIDAALATANLTADVVFLDDGSTVEYAGRLNVPELGAVDSVEVLRIARNLGHQRAISIGMAWASENRAGRVVVVMDGDGEDNPADIPELLARFKQERGEKIIFADGQRRMERWQLQWCYRVYQLVHWLLTGHRVRVGNFSVVPPQAVQQLAVISETWNHYKAAVSNSRIPHDVVPISRARRIGGHSRMNLSARAVHGLSALSVFSHIIALRLLAASGVVALVTFLGLVIALLTSGGTSSRPTWFTMAIAWLLATVIESAIFWAAFVLLMLFSRQGTTFIPKRDYRYFVASLTRVSPRS
jgi:polyisoprenyl-phosphate glycosyltransferase